MHNLNRIKDFFKENKRTYIIGIMWLISVDTVQLFFPRLLGSLTDTFQSGSMTGKKLLIYSSLILLVGIFSGIARYYWRIYISGNSAKLDYKLRKDFFSHLLTLSPNYFYTNKTGDLMSHGTNDIMTIRRSMGMSLIMFFDSSYMIIFSLVMMVITTNLKLTLIAAINLPLIVLFTRIFGDIVYNRSRETQESFSELTEFTQESYSGIRVIKSFAQEDLIFEEFKRSNENNYRKNLNLVKVSGFFVPTIRFIYYISILITIYYGGRQVIQGQISLGDFIAFNSYLAGIHWPVRSIGQIVNNIQRGLASLDRLEDIFQIEGDIKEIENPLSKDKYEGEIEFKDVYFKYPEGENYALENINLKINPGETLAIIGRTGSGKSTITDLILRLYDIDRGNILFDGIDIRKMPLKDLRENIAYVPQDNFLFSYSIKDNIAFAYDEEVDDEKVYKAAKNADVYDNIIEFPEGFNTVLGERGITLSGGQKQRTSMARAFIKDSPVLILDDSLSAVDTETEETILQNLKDFAKDKTKIIVSHRVSTIKNADEIIVLDEGKIIERGNHYDLMDEDGIYAELYEKQLLEEAEEGLNE